MEEFLLTPDECKLIQKSYADKIKNVANGLKHIIDGGDIEMLNRHLNKIDVAIRRIHDFARRINVAKTDIVGEGDMNEK